MIVKHRKIVIDTNVLLSALLWPASIPAMAFRHAIVHADPIVSIDTLREYADVFSRPKFDSYASLRSRLDFLRLFGQRADVVEVRQRVHDCIDAKDNMFLATALAGQAEIIMSGDGDLLALHPWRGVSILKPSEYLEHMS